MSEVFNLRVVSCAKNRDAEILRAQGVTENIVNELAGSVCIRYRVRGAKEKVNV